MGRKRTPPKNTEYFTYDKRNPKGIVTNDCVVRAISCAMDKPWEEVFDGLYEIAKKKCRMLNDDKVYEEYLSNNGWVKQKALKDCNNKRYTMNELCENLLPNTTIIVHISKHLTCIKDGKIYDSWNCGTYSAGVYYKKES